MPLQTGGLTWKTTDKTYIGDFAVITDTLQSGTSVKTKQQLHRDQRGEAMDDAVLNLAHGVVLPPGRKHPGIIVMGDTFASMVSDVTQALGALKRLSCDQETIEIDRLAYVRERLSTMLETYKTVLRSKGMAFPFTENSGSSNTEHKGCSK